MKRPLDRQPTIDPAWRWHVTPTSAGAARHYAGGAGLALIAGAALLAGGGISPELEPPLVPVAVDFVALPAIVPTNPPPELGSPEPAPTEPKLESPTAPPEADPTSQSASEFVAPEPEPAAPQALPPTSNGPVVPMTPSRVVQAVRPDVVPQHVKPARPRPAMQAHPSPSAAAVAPAAASTPQEVAPVTPSPGELAVFRASMHDVVQSALIYPAALRMAGQGGDVRVEFDFEDGRVSNLIPVSRSAMPLLDQAAVRTVANAHYPLPPSSLAHRLLHLSVMLHFDPSGP